MSEQPLERAQDAIDEARAAAAKVPGLDLPDDRSAAQEPEPEPEPETEPEAEPEPEPEPGPTADAAAPAEPDDPS